MLCIGGIIIFMKFRERKLRSAISAVASFVMLASIVIERLLAPLAPGYMKLRSWIIVVCLAVVIILAVVCKRLPKDEDASTGSF